MTKKPETPNLDLQRDVQYDANIISDFIDFLFDEQGYNLARYEETGKVDVWNGEPITEFRRVRWGSMEREAMIAKFFNIDHEALLRERQAMQEWLSASSRPGPKEQA